MNDEPAIITRAAPLEPTTWNPEARTFEIVFSSGAPVERWDVAGPHIEVLDLDQDWRGFAGRPVLASHNRYDLKGVLGHVVSARTVGKEARAVVKMSSRADVEEIVVDILAGHIRGVSVGYTVQAWRETTEGNPVRRVKTATKWTAVEVSIVAIPADPKAKIRSTTMPETTTDPAETGVTTTTAAATTAAAGERAETNIQIRSIAKLSGLDQAWIDRQVDTGATIEQARAAAFEAIAQRSEGAQVRTTRVDVTSNSDDPEVRVRTIAEALYSRWTPSHKLSEPARQYAGLTILDLARDSLRQRSIATTGLAPASVIERALHTTSDFPLILGDSIGRTLREAYRAAPSGLKLVGRQTTARDFRDKHRLQLSEAPRLEKVNEAGEFKSGTLAEAKESYRLATFGRIISISRQALVNDDLGAFADLARRLGQAAAATEAQLLVDLLVSGAGNGPAMSDGKALFHTGHSNKAATGAAISVASLSAARTAMRKQVGLTGELIEVTPKFLVIPSDLETDAEQLLASLMPAKADDVNPFSGKLSLVVEPRLTDAKRWYVSADAASIDGLEFSHLEGQEGVQTETRAGFEVDGVQIRARVDFGAGFVDWRGWYQNAGA